MRSSGRAPPSAGTGALIHADNQAQASKPSGSPDSRTIVCSCPSRRPTPSTRSPSAGERGALVLALRFTVWDAQLAQDDLRITSTDAAFDPLDLRQNRCLVEGDKPLFSRLEPAERPATLSDQSGLRLQAARPLGS